MCGGCRAHPPAFDAAIAGTAYDFPMANLVRRLKYGSALELVPAIAAPLIAAIAAVRAERRVDALVALPLAPARQRERGYNQAREIAREIGRATGLPLTHGLDRALAGPPQAALPWRERARNVRGAFVARRRFDGERLALVDDVLTTGSTAAAAAAALARAGAARIEVWVAARTPPGARA